MSNSIVKKVLDWNEKKFEELDESRKSDMIKAFGRGALDGLVDAAVFWFIPTLLAAYYWKDKAQKK